MACMVNTGRSEAGLEYDLFLGMSVQKEYPSPLDSKVLEAVGLVYLWMFYSPRADCL